jgi:transcriptional regulator with XRE-family HTH domain
MTPPTQDPQRLQRRRIQAGLNKTELATRAGIHKTTIGRYERGLSSALPGKLKKLAEALDCEIADLMPPEPGTTAGDA